MVCTLVGDMYRGSYGNYNPWDPPFVPGRSVALCCGQRDRAAFQLLLFDRDEDRILTVANEPALHKVWPLPVCRIGCKLPGTGEDCRVSLSLVEDVRDDDGNYKAEILLSAQKKVQERLRTAQVWVEIQTGDDMAPGLYEGSIQVWECRLFEDERLVESLPFSLRVLPVRLPVGSDFYLDLWQHHTSLARTYETPLWGEMHFELMGRYLDTLVGLGQKAATVIVSEAPWSGQWSAWYRTNPSDVFEYSMIRVTKKREGGFCYDFSVMNRYIRLCLEKGVDREIEIFGLFGIWTLPDAGLGGVLEDGGQAVRVRYYDEESGRMCYIRKRKQLEDYIRAIDRELTQRGWAHLAQAACDEPADREAFRRELGWLKTLMPHIRFKVTVCGSGILGEDYAEISDCVVNLPLLLQNRDLTTKLRGKYRLHYYTAIEPPHPNTFLCCHPAEIRFLPWLSILLGTDGFLRWAAWLWPDRPFDWDSYHFQKFKAGGMQLVYPGKDAKPLYSLRYKQLQRGIRDYTILKEYEKRTGQDIVPIVQRVLKTDLQQLAGCRQAEEFLFLEQGRFDEITDTLLGELAEEGESQWR